MNEAEKRKSACEGKISYVNLSSARKIKKRMRKRKPLLKKGYLKVYLCEFCDLFHLGHTWHKD